MVSGQIAEASPPPPIPTSRESDRAGVFPPLVARWGKRLSHGLVCLVLFLAAAEIAARLDDWIHLGIPFWSSPDRQRDLLQAETWGYRGKPNGLFKHWKLNNFGFRGPDISLEPAPQQIRLMALGASETFGYLESNGKEYPAQLRTLLQEKGSYEVVNAAMAGASLRSLTTFWEHWASRFKPRIVLIYPSPMFYLNESLTTTPSPAEIAGASERSPFRSRLGDRALDCYRSLPFWLRSMRREWLLQKEMAGKGADWFLTEPPEDRLALYRADVARLVEQVRAAGAEPVLITHAISATSPPRPEDQPFLTEMRFSYPRLTPEAYIALEQRGNAILRDLARKENVALIDADRALSGHREWFGDLVHFNDEGAARMAELVAELVLNSGSYDRVSARSQGSRR